jgi:ribA/ribD-fused uncharacterized protein
MVQFRDKIEEFQGVNRVFSNFWLVPIMYEGMLYPSVEHAYQAAKTLDKKIRYMFTNVTPAQAKLMGKTMPIREDWEELKIPVMTELVLIKFTTDDYCRERLLKTKDMILVEGNRWGDTFWGVDLRTGKGQNHLGKILMEVRSILSLTTQ